jgi:vacuolar-type H+-ATPase subunit I/STV1
MIDNKTLSLIKTTESWATTIESFKVITTDDYQKAGELSRSIKEKQKELDEMRRSLTKPLDESKKRIIEFFKKPLEKLEAIQYYVNNQMLRFSELERQKLEEEKRKAQEEMAKLEKKAVTADQKGNIEKAEELRAKQYELEQTAESATITKVEGISYRKVWHYRITSEKDIPREYLIPDEKKIAETIRKEKEKTDIKGVEIYSEDVIVRK